MPSLKEISSSAEKYQIILADPPWSYRDKALAGNRGAICKYTVQSIDWLKDLPINDISSKNCALFLWVTMPQLSEGLEVIKAWGFQYKTVGFTWVKRNKKSNSWFFGMGSWTRSNAELCLLGTKGKPKRISASVSSIIDTPIEEHSKKPSVVRDQILSLMGDLPRIELFARQKAEGWDAMGYDVDGCDLKENLNLLARKLNQDVIITRNLKIYTV